jgi:hypothetical protein
MLYRRIGSNELDAIEICRGYVDAQLEYAMEKHDGSEVNQYAQRVISTPGKHDGLVWRNDDGTLGGPIAEGIAKALQQGYTDKSQPYHGYYFKILKGQGPAAPLGEMNFVVGGAMIGGFALAAAPAEYRVTGVQTFIVSYQGIVYQKDLGPDTLKIFRAMDLYNPDKTWHPTEDKWVPIKGADEPDQLTAKQITSAIDADLASKGLTKTDSDDANLYIGYQTAVGSEKQYTSYNTGWGYGPGWGAGYSGYGAVADKDTSGRVSPLLPPHPRRP